jgi:hypothetical protein
MSAGSVHHCSCVTADHGSWSRSGSHAPAQSVPFASEWPQPWRHTCRPSFHLGWSWPVPAEASPQLCKACFHRRCILYLRACAPPAGRNQSPPLQLWAQQFFSCAPSVLDQTCGQAVVRRLQLFTRPALVQAAPTGIVDARPDMRPGGVSAIEATHSTSLCPGGMCLLLISAVGLVVAFQAPLRGALALRAIGKRTIHTMRPSGFVGCPFSPFRFTRT